MDELLWQRMARLTDGREIDESLGTLAGEAGRLEVKHPNEAFPVEVGVARKRATELQTETGPSYYGLPLVKEPVWIWTIPTYFFVGGAAGASSLLATTLSLPRRQADRRLLRRARWLGAIGDTLSAGLLIYDLGRPTRFLNMLRVFRKSSPMSVGSWVLAASGACNTADALFAERRGLFGFLGRGAGLIGGLLGMPLAGYTGVLIASTAVPLWQQTRRSLPLAFMASGVATGAALLELLPCDRHEARVLRRYGVAGKVGELAATALMRAEAARVPRVARPLNRGVSGALFNAGTALTAASLVLSLLPASPGRRRAAAVTAILGGLAMRFGVFHGGKASARDPHATFAQQRQARRQRRRGEAAQARALPGHDGPQQRREIAAHEREQQEDATATGEPARR